jgi:DNA topoisomerase VI subunit B
MATVSTNRKLERTTFRTSREMDFFSKRELVTQTGHPVSEWPLVVVKELVDNALDACEEAGVGPEVRVTADASGITVKDNGPGLPEETLQGALDFTVRVSNREAYVSPCRGAQGNALKTILPMPWVLDEGRGKLIVAAGGRRHTLRVGVDPISQRPVIYDEVVDTPTCGTKVRLEWQPHQQDGLAGWPFEDDGLFAEGIEEPFKGLVEGFALFNPHATVRLDWFGGQTTWAATNPAWPKWRPDQPTSAHWYEVEHLERLLGAYITHDRKHGTDRLVSEFLAEFDGLTRSGKRTKVLQDTGLKRAHLSDLVVDDRIQGTDKLLEAMRRHTRPVRSPRLGVIGEEHFRARLLGMGIEEKSFRYRRKVEKSTKPGQSAAGKACFLPWVLESAFGYLGPDAAVGRRIYTGANWSAAIKNPFRTFGATGEGLETQLADLRATRDEPIVFVLHLACPRVAYTDRGKSAVVIGR